MTRHVLYAPRNISGQATEYAKAVRPFDWVGEVWSLGAPAHGFQVDRVLDRERLLTDPEQRWQLLRETVERFDLFHFQYGRSLLSGLDPVLPRLWDIPLLASLGRPVVMHFRGSDIRLPSLHRSLEQDSYLRGVDDPAREEQIRDLVEICRRYCSVLAVSTPGLLDHVPDAVWVPHIVDLKTFVAQPRAEGDRRLVVAHIPSNRIAKASDDVELQLRPLVTRGLIDLRVRSGLSRAQIVQVMATADIVVDSLTIGDHGLTSVEAMASGAIAIAHIRQGNRDRNPGVPVVEATPSSLATVVTELAHDHDRRRELAATGRQWVEQRHSATAVAPQLVDLYDEPVPSPRAHPDWPHGDLGRRIQQLELALSDRRGRVNQLLEGIGQPHASLPRFASDRLQRRIRELEDALAVANPEHVLLEDVLKDRVRERVDLTTWVKGRPRLHRLARRAEKLLRKVV